MTLRGERYIEAPSLSEAWLDAVALLRGQPSRRAVHVLVRIMSPQAEVAAIRAIADRTIDEWNQTHAREVPAIDTTRNTIFPAAFAQRTDGPAHLAEYYRQRYTRDGLLGFSENRRGTYFGRIVAYPRANGTIGDQLTETVRKLRQELSNHAPKGSRYEINIYNERRDRSPMGFPCLAHLSIHLHGKRLHMQAIYRNEWLIARAYGNYLGLAQLQSYLAKAVEIEPGELLVTAGHVELEGSASFHQRILGTP